MSSEEEPGLAPRRLHPAGIAVLGVASLKELALPLMVAFVTAVLGAGGGGEPLFRVLAFGAFGALIAVVAGVVRWMTTTWAVSDAVIRYRTGVVSRKETDIPLSRVQAVDTVYGPLQRLFGVRGVHVQSAGGGREGEIRLPAVAPGDVAALRAAASPRRPRRSPSGGSAAATCCSRR
jgi:putative membrane protein